MTDPARAHRIAIPPALEEARSLAVALDGADPLAGMRGRFTLPSGAGGRTLTYLAGQSLGAQPAGARAAVDAELDRWATLGVEGHFHQPGAWVEFDEPVREPTARLVGARPGEVSTLNTLTVNLHLLMASFYRPTGPRTRILIEAPTFPSDRYAVESQLRYHGLDPAQHLVVVRPAGADRSLDQDLLEASIRAEGDRLAMVLLAGVNYATGQRLDIERHTRAAHDVGAVTVWDLAHAVGNVALALHDWGVDAAAWCTYKYLNAGPGAIGQLFVHERRTSDAELPRLEGWWGNDLASRFRMAETFEPSPGADAWQLSTLPVLSTAPLAASLELFEEAGLAALRTKSVALTGFLESLLDRFVPDAELLTPRRPDERGCQLSIRVPGARARRDALEARGVVTDFREPDIIRIAPVPLYNTFLDAWTAVDALAGTTG
ncbi:MAG TPA: kynureninase [Candidatus Limnocylindrales bacterium]|nr:kynureninase [Candidatus Limnocylindrales bacterium]